MTRSFLMQNFGMKKARRTDGPENYRDWFLTAVSVREFNGKLLAMSSETDRVHAVLMFVNQGFHPAPFDHVRLPVAIIGKWHKAPPAWRIWNVRFCGGNNLGGSCNYWCWYVCCLRRSRWGWNWGRRWYRRYDWLHWIPWSYRCD